MRRPRRPPLRRGRRLLPLGQQAEDRLPRARVLRDRRLGRVSPDPRLRRPGVQPAREGHDDLGHDRGDRARISEAVRVRDLPLKKILFSFLLPPATIGRFPLTDPPPARDTSKTIIPFLIQILQFSPSRQRSQGRQIRCSNCSRPQSGASGRKQKFSSAKCSVLPAAER